MERETAERLGSQGSGEHEWSRGGEALLCCAWRRQRGGMSSWPVVLVGQKTLSRRGWARGRDIYPQPCCSRFQPVILYTTVYYRYWLIIISIAVRSLPRGPPVSRTRHPRFTTASDPAIPISLWKTDLSNRVRYPVRMARHDDFRSSSTSLDSGGGRWDTERFTRERQERSYRTTVTERERERPFDEDRFERRLFEQERYGPPARRPERFYEDDHLDHHLDRSSSPPHHSGPLVSYGADRSSPSPPPRLIRRQSSLDTFDRIPSRKKRDHYYRHEESDYRPRSSRAPPVVPPAPRSPPRRISPPGGRYYDDFYEDIRIAEPDCYGDEEFRNFRERERTVEHRRRRSHESIHEQIKMTEKPYPRKGKTRMPRRLVHTRAIIELGYPFEEEVRWSFTFSSSSVRLIFLFFAGGCGHHPEGPLEGADR